MKRTILTGLIIGLVILIVETFTGQVFIRLFPALVAEYENPSMFRAWSEPLMQLYFLYPFVFGLVMSWFWSKTKPIVMGRSACTKGTKFGLAMWLVASVPGMLITYASFQVSFLMVVSWTVGGLIALIAAGCLLARFN